MTSAAAHPAILITGATGFLGKALVASLPSSAARIAVRRAAPAPVGMTSVTVGDIDDRTDWSEALAGIDCIVHLAAHTHVMTPSSQDRLRYRDTNVLGTQRLASAAARAGVRRFIFLSTVKVNGESTSSRPFSAKDVPSPQDDYAISKWQAEQGLFEIASRADMEAVAIRSPLVYGPDVGANFLRLMDWVRRGVPLPFGAVSNARSMVSIWNLCDLIRALISEPAIRNGPLMVSDGEDLSTPDLIRRLAAALGRPARLVRVPSAVLIALSRPLGLGAELRRVCGSLAVDMSETCRSLNWTPPVSVDEGLRRTAAWYLGKQQRD